MSKFLVGCVILLAFGAFLVIESIHERVYNLTMAGFVAIVLGFYGIFVRRGAINRALFSKGLYFLPLIFGVMFLLAGVSGFFIVMRPRSMTWVSRETAIFEIYGGLVLTCLAVVMWVIQKLFLMKQRGKKDS